MDGIVVLVLLVGMAVLAATAVTFVNLGSINRLKKEVGFLDSQVTQLKYQLKKLTLEGSVQPTSVSQETSQNVEQVAPQVASKPTNVDAAKPTRTTPIPPKSTAPASTKKATTSSFNFDKFLSGNGLLWLGAIVLALGGVFLAKYSIEAGLFPPEMRIILGSLFGICLVVAAEFIYRRPKQFQLGNVAVCAALASGGIITCFAMTYVAFDFYAFLSPGLAFVILAVIAVAGTLLSLRYGPVLALIGLIGAYAVPAIVSTGSNNVFALLLYVAFVSFAATWVFASVKQVWLWWLALAGNMAWLFIALSVGNDSHVWPIFGFAMVSIYLFVLQPVLGWRLANTHTQALDIKVLLMPRKEQLGVVLPTIALVLMFALFSYQADFIIMVVLASALLMFMPFRHSAFDTWPFLALGLAITVYLQIPQSYDLTDNLFPFTHGYFYIQLCALVALVYSVLTFKYLPQRPAFLLYLVAAPLLCMGIAYALSPSSHATHLYPVWAIELLIVCCVFGFVSSRTTQALQKVSYLLLANGALALSFTMLLSPSVLTLALVAQIASMSYLSKRFSITLPAWLYKVAISIVLLRFSLAPWLHEYADETVFGVHWTLIIYPLAIALFYFAKMQQQNQDVAAWKTSAILHILALLVTTETSYLLIGSYPNFFDLSYQQIILLSMNWLILAVFYTWHRNKASSQWQQRCYTAYALILFFGTALCQLYLSGTGNPFLLTQNTGEHALLNWLIPLWAVPAAVLGFGIYTNILPKNTHKTLWSIIGVFVAFYINGVIRGIYHPTLSFASNGVSQQELYVYSVVWLLISVVFIVVAHNRKLDTLNKVGFGILAIVVLKAFIVDLSNLSGLYRALSFIGLGLCLVAVGWLFQRLKNTNKPSDETAVPS